MKAILLTIILACIGPISVSIATEITASDIARHLGISFWKFDSSQLPEHYTVALMKIEDGQISKSYLGGFSFPSNEDLVVAVSIPPDGKIIATISAGNSTGSVTESQRMKIGHSTKHSISKVTPGVPIVLMGDYQSDENTTVLTGNVADIASGLALLIVEEETFNTKAVVEEEAVVANLIRIKVGGGGIELDGKSVSQDELASSLQKLPQGSSVLIAADRETPHKEVVSVLNLLKENGVTDVAFSVSNAEHPTSNIQR